MTFFTSSTSFYLLYSIRFPQMLHYNLHFRFQQILAVLVISRSFQFSHHHAAPREPPPEASGGRFLCGIREIHHCQFTFLIQPRLESLLLVIGISVHCFHTVKLLKISLFCKIFPYDFGSLSSFVRLCPYWFIN